MNWIKPLTALALSISCAYAGAQALDPLKEVARKALETNPEVTARLNAYRAALRESFTRVVAGAFATGVVGVEVTVAGA